MEKRDFVKSPAQYDMDIHNFLGITLQSGYEFPDGTSAAFSAADIVNRLQNLRHGISRAACKAAPANTIQIICIISDVGDILRISAGEDLTVGVEGYCNPDRFDAAKAAEDGRIQDHHRPRQ